jgi:hypothetical protein
MRHLAIIKENNMSNFMLTDGIAPISDGQGKILLRARYGLICTLQRKSLIYKQGDGKYQTCNRIKNFKHSMNCCITRGTQMTERHENVRRDLTQAIQIYPGQDIIVFKTENYVN